MTARTVAFARLRASLPVNNPGPAEREAAAAMRDAAPTLLAALEWLIAPGRVDGLVIDYSERVAFARAAIARAVQP